MAKETYKGFDTWNKLLQKYKGVDFSSEEQRSNFLKDFEYSSSLMWEKWLTNMDTEDLVEQLTETWHIPVGSMNDKTPKEIFDAAIDYCGGVSDRMNINRWFHIRDLLNLTIH